MDLSDPAPMVNGTLLRRFENRKIRTVVKVDRRDGGGITAKMPDGAPVTIRPAQGSTYSDQFVEVIGIVEAPNVIREETSTNFGNNFDHESYNQLCNLANGQYQQLFYA